MSRFALCLAAVALACGRTPPLSALEIDRRADQLTQNGRWDDARALVERGLAEARGHGDRAALARLELRRGRIVTNATRHRGGDGTPAVADLEAALADAEAIGDPELRAGAIDGLGMHVFVHWFASEDPAELAAAAERFTAARALRVPAGDSAGLAESEFHVGLIHQMRGELPQAQDRFAASFAVATRVHALEQLAESTRHLAYLADLRHDGATAEAYYRRSLELRMQLGFGPGVPAAQVTLAELRYRRDGDVARARAALTEARDGAARAHSAAYVAISSAALARVERDAGRVPVALAELAAAIAAVAAIHSDEGVVDAHEQRALLELLAGDPAAARRDVDLGLAVRHTPRLEALGVLARGGAPASAIAPAPPDPVVTARLALAAGDAAAAFEAALVGDEPDTLLLAARAVGAAAVDRAIAAAAALSRAQGLRFARELGRRGR